MFQGATALNLDAKGRMAIPARHRAEASPLAAGSVVVTAHPHRCLMLYPQDAWTPIREKILATPSLDPQAAMLRRLLVGFAVDMEIDSAGRLLIAPELRGFAELDKSVWLVGQGNHFEIWSDTGWKAQQDAIFSLGDKLLPQGFENLSL